jgi:hypothetical protein
MTGARLDVPAIVRDAIAEGALVVVNHSGGAWMKPESGAGVIIRSCRALSAPTRQERGEPWRAITL